MKKRVIIFVAVIIIAITSILLINKSFIEDGQDYLKGILETAKPQNISIFMLPAVPIITIISPENITYFISTILLNYSVKNAENVWYNLDNLENITIASPLYFSAAEDSHVLYLYANNSQGTSFKSVIFSIEIGTTPPSGGSEGGGEGGGGEAGETKPLKENITSAEDSPNITEQEMPKNITQKPEEKPSTFRKITIKFLISLLFIILLIFLVIILIVIAKKKLKKEKQKKKK